MKTLKNNEKYINKNGITNSISSIFKNVSEKNDWYLDLLENGNWLVSNHNTQVAVFANSEEAIFYFIGNADPIELPEMTAEEEIQCLEEMIEYNERNWIKRIQ